jgi:septum site-determining protein MinD
LDPVKSHLLITRYHPERVDQGEMMSVEDIKGILGIPVLGVIPESESVLNASNVGTPVILDERSPAGVAYSDMVDRFLGENRPLRFTQSERKGILRRIFGS